MCACAEQACWGMNDFENTLTDFGAENCPMPGDLCATDLWYDTATDREAGVICVGHMALVDGPILWEWARV